MNARHQKVLVWVFCREGENLSFLLLKTKPERGSFWQPVTGSVEKGEDLSFAALREMREETGLKALRMHPVSQPYEFESRGRTVQEHPFLGEVEPGSRGRVRLDPHEHVEFQWLSGEKALGQLKFESNARVLRDVLQHLKGENK